MKQPTAPPIYPELPSEDGQNYRLQKISDIEKQLSIEMGARKSLYKKYKRAMNITDGLAGVLFSAGVVMASVGLAVPLLMPLEIAAIVCGSVGACIRLVGIKLSTKVQKHHEIKTLAASKLNSIKDLVSKALRDGQISEQEFETILCELKKYNEMKDNVHTLLTGLSEQERKKLIEEGKMQAMSVIQKKIKGI